MNDLLLRLHGSVNLVVAVTPAGQEWLDHNVPEDALWFGHALVVQPRYTGALIEGAENDGLEIA